LRIINAYRGDALACRAILLEGRPVEDAIRRLSTTERIVVALACGREDLLPRAYPNFRDGWRMLDDRQRRLADIAARRAWPARDEGAVL
jgi:hypothetical protein